MFRKYLYQFIFLLLIPVSAFPGESLDIEFQRDTTNAGSLFRIAQKMQNKAEYDSAVYFYELAAKSYGTHKYLENYLKCRNNILQVKRRTGPTEGLFNDAFINLKTCIIKFGDSRPISADCYSILGNLYSDVNNQDSALYFFRKALQILKKSPESNKKNIADIFRNMGVVYCSKGIFDSASFYVDKSTRLLNDLLGLDHPELAENYNLSGTIAYHLGRFDECKHYFSKIVKIREKSVGFSHPLTAEALNNLAVLYYAKGNFDTALILNLRALEIRISKLPENHKDIALSLNNIGNIYLETSKFELAEKYHKRALEIRNKIFKTENADLAMSYANLGVLDYKMGRYDEALNYFLKFLNITEKLYGPDNPHTSDAYNNVGAVYSDLGDNERSLNYLKKALAMRKKRGEYSPGVSTSYNNIGSIYKFHGDYDLALSYYRKSIDIIRKLNGNSHPDLADKYNNIGEIYAYEGQNDTALIYFNKALELDLSVLGKDNTALTSIYLNRGNIFGKLKEPDKEIKDYRKGLTIARNSFGENHPVVANFYKAISSFLFTEGKKDSSLILQRKATQLNERGYAQHHPVLASSYRDLGELHQSLGNLDSAGIFYDKSLRANYTQPLLPENFNASFVLSENEFASTIFDICQLNYNEYSITRNERLLVEIVTYFDFLKPIINREISDYVLEETKIKMLNQLSKHTGLAVDAANILFRRTGDTKYFYKAFEFSELNKSSILQNLAFRFKPKGESDIPDRLLRKKKNLLGYIDYLQMKLNKSDPSPGNISSGKVKGTIDSLMLCLREVNDSVNICNLNSNIPSSTTGKELYEKTKTHLKGRDALISYFISDSALFTFIITRDTTLLFKHAFCKQDTLNILINEYLSTLKKYEKEKLPGLNSALYGFLFKDFENVIASKEKLIIIPDKILFSVPFEALCREMLPSPEFKDFASFDYLIRKHDLIYHYSTGLWCLDKTSPTDTDNGFLAFAPVFPQNKENNTYDISFPAGVIRASFGELPYSLAEVDSLKNMFETHGIKTKIFTFNDASETNLKHNIEKYNYVHIATHGFMDNNHPEYSGLIFAANPSVVFPDSLSEFNNDGIVYAKDLYPLEIKANLVVLSACETGMGKLEEGEGIIGLIRGFLSAGASNVLFSFWKVGDKSTLLFMNRFYRSMLNGNSYSSALRNAKIELINNPETSFPLFWGGFALIGH